MRPTAFTLQYANSENQDLYVPFSCETTIAVTLQNMSSENQDQYGHFCYDNNTAFTLQNMPSKNRLYERYWVEYGSNLLGNRLA